MDTAWPSFMAAPLSFSQGGDEFLGGGLAQELRLLAGEPLRPVLEDVRAELGGEAGQFAEAVETPLEGELVVEV
ncbi:hypothetical protein ACN28I_24690 [Archangium gephyra]|uniref:hypothetical protein n=1 Tax=Archangium gephyra TaxID=48 RepID=UPI003B7C4831